MHFKLAWQEERSEQIPTTPVTCELHVQLQLHRLVIMFISFFRAGLCLTNGFIYAPLSLTRLTYRLQTIRKKSNERTCH